MGVFCTHKGVTMNEELQGWAERLSEIQDELGALYEKIDELRGELKTAGRKNDANAFNEPLDRLARYGRLFSDIYITWTEVD